MNALAELKLLQDHADLDAFIFQGPGGKDWVARMEDSQDRAAQVCIFEASRALAALLETYGIDTIHPRWKADGTYMELAFEMWKDGTKDSYPVGSKQYTMTWTDAVDGSATWQDAMAALDDTAQPSLIRCVEQLNRAFPKPMDARELRQASMEHAREVEALWQETALKQATPRAAAQVTPRRP